MVRIDDIDQTRTVTNADKLISEQLENLCLFWDEDIVYQSQRLDLYEAALEALQKLKLTFPCSCRRKDLSEKPYPGTCRNGSKPNIDAQSIRIKTNDTKIIINNQLQGHYVQCLGSEVGDFIIKCADGFFAYHLAAVVDDVEQNITEIVRGADLLESTPGQVYLQQKLNLPTPAYLHLPVAIDITGKKISKSIKSESISFDNPGDTLFNALRFLGQKPPEELKTYSEKSMLDQAVKN